MARATFSFTLDETEDKRIITYLDGLPHGQKGKTIRDALAQYIGGAGISHYDILQAVKSLERKVKSGVVLSSEPERIEEDPELAAALDNLGL